MKTILQRFTRSQAIRVAAVILTAVFGTATVCGWYVTNYLYRTGFYQASSLNSIQQQKTQNLRKAYEIDILAQLAYAPTTTAREEALHDLAIGENSNLRFIVTQSDHAQPDSDTPVFATNADLDDNMQESAQIREQYSSHLTFQTDTAEHKGDSFFYVTNPLGNLLYTSTLESAPTKQTFGKSVTSVVLNRSDNIFYYITSDELAYPVRSITLQVKDIQPQPENVSEVIFILNEEGSYADPNGVCNPLNTYRFGRWENPKFGQIYMDTDEISYVNSDSLPTIDRQISNYHVVKNEDAGEEAVNHIQLCYEQKMDYSSHTYQLYSVLNEPFDPDASDLFFTQRKFVTMGYTYRYAVIGCSLAASLLLLAFLLFCCLTVGKTSTESSRITARHRFPFALLLLAVGALLLFGIHLIDQAFADLLTETGHAALRISLGTLLGILFCIFIVGTLLFMTFSFRIQAAIFRETFLLSKSSVTYQRLQAICRKIVPELQKVKIFVYEHTSLLLRGGGFLLLLSLLEAFLIIVSDGDAEFLLVLWFLFKIVEIPFVFFVLLHLNTLQQSSQKLAEGDLTHKTDTSRMFWDFKKHGENLNRIGEGMNIAIQERLKSERFKTELITNVSHDIKTPLTSIINYVDLLRKDADDPQKTEEYLEVLERQTTRLKKLIEDLIEASKASTGNLPVTLTDCDVDILLTQTLGEFEEKLRNNQLELIIRKSNEIAHIQADQRHLWRIFDNLMSNICKYAQPNTRVYIDEEIREESVFIIFRNTSKYALTTSGEELLERFVRGDSSRATDGNGLGLSIAQSLTNLMNGTLEIRIDGDLFKVILTFLKE